MIYIYLRSKYHNRITLRLVSVNWTFYKTEIRNVLCKNVYYLNPPKRECGERPIRLMTIGVGHRSAPKIVGGHTGQRAGTQHVGIHGDGRYVVVHEITTQSVPVAHRHGRGHGHVYADRGVWPPVLLAASFEATTGTGTAAAILVVLLMMLLLLQMLVVIMIVVVVMKMWRPPHRTANMTRARSPKLMKKKKKRRNSIANTICFYSLCTGVTFDWRYTCTVRVDADTATMTVYSCVSETDKGSVGDDDDDDDDLNSTNRPISAPTTDTTAACQSPMPPLRALEN